MSNGLENMIRRAFLMGYAEALCKDRDTGMSEREAVEAESAAEKFLRVFP